MLYQQCNYNYNYVEQANLHNWVTFASRLVAGFLAISSSSAERRGGAG
jgi:hypothetical protein